MGSDISAPEVEVGRIVFRSWEHEWKTGESEAQSVASAMRLLPSDLTSPIYEILERWEQDLLRSSLPFSPYGLRIRRANNGWMAFRDGNYHLVEYGIRDLPIGKLCENWETALPQPQEKQGRYRILKAPSADTRVSYVYEVKWLPVFIDFHQTSTLDRLLREYSPRYKEPRLFG